MGATAVVDENNLVKGIITDGDLRRMLEKNILSNDTTAKDIYTQNSKLIHPESLAIEALELMRKSDISQLIVSKNNIYLGIIHLHDLVREGIV